MNLSYGLDVIYDEADFRIDHHDKVGIIGVNGAGKTTLFRVLLKEQGLDSGRVECGNARIGYLPQEIALDDNGMTMLDYLMAGRPIRDLQAELEQVYGALELANGGQDALLERMAQLQEQLEYYDCYRAESILLDIVDRMKIDADLLDKPLARLSGGQKSKIAFAWVLYSKPEILLLDEPTNHLDPETQKVIGENFHQYPGTMIVVSHNPFFVERIGINRILLYHPGM